MVRTTRLLITAALTTATVVAGSAVGSSSDAATGPSVHVHGRLLVVPSEVPGGHPAYGVAVAGGDIVPVSGHFGPEVRTGAVFDGRLALPASVVSTLAARDESGTAAALRIVDRRSLTLSVVGSPSTLPQVTSATVTPTTHQQFVAAVDNTGSLQTDSQLLAHVSTVGNYWKAESNGAIAGITVPATVTHYNTALATSDCGLGSDFFTVVQEAAKKFPSLDLSQDSPDQLVLFVSDDCSSGGVVGEGTIGASFASGGALIVKATPAIEGTYAHETGHNYGFEHANARVGSRSLEYFGVYDVMGFALDGFNQLTALSTPFRVFQGITDPGEIQSVDLGDGSSAVHATATIAPRSDDSGVRSVRVTNPDSGENLYLDYRSGGGQDAGSFYTTPGYFLTDPAGDRLDYRPGVTVNAVHDGSGNDVLADVSGHTYLGEGDAWTDASGRLTVTVASISPTGADVSVDYTPTPLVIYPAPTPSVTGTPRVGATLQVATGTWMAGTSLGYRWYVAGSPVAGATGSSYVPRAADRGKTLDVVVTGSHPGYPSVERTSPDTAAVAAGVLTSAKPTITGRTKVGKRLTARHGAWTQGTRFSYAWYANGARIRHHSDRTLTLTKAQKDKRITVKVTGRKPGYTAVSRTSARTGKVR